MKHFKGYKIDTDTGKILSNDYNIPKNKKFTEAMEKYKEKQKEKMNKTNKTNKRNKIVKSSIDLKRDKFAQVYYKKDYDMLSSCDKAYIDNEMRDFYE